MSGAAVSNDELTAFWNNVLVEKFERFRNILMEGLSYHSQVPLRNLKLARGAKVLDGGCGWGDTAIQFAKLVGPTGSVMGLDCCDAFLKKGRKDAKEAGFSNIYFVEADVQTYRFEPEYDLCFSRFGMMFFSIPVAAKRNIRSALKPGGRLMFVVWRARGQRLGWNSQNGRTQISSAAGRGCSNLWTGPVLDGQSGSCHAQLKSAGFDEVSFERSDGPVMVGGTVEQALQFQLAVGPAGEIFREAGQEAERRRREIEDALRAELARYQENGEVIMQSSSWTITARKRAA